MYDVATGAVLFCNPAGARLWGRSGAAWRESAEAWLAAVHPDDQARVRQAFSPDGPLATADEEYRDMRRLIGNLEEVEPPPGEGLLGGISPVSLSP